MPASAPVRVLAPTMIVELVPPNGASIDMTDQPSVPGAMESAIVTYNPYSRAIWSLFPRWPRTTRSPCHPLTKPSSSGMATVAVCPVARRPSVTLSARSAQSSGATTRMVPSAGADVGAAWAWRGVSIGKSDIPATTVVASKKVRRLVSIFAPTSQISGADVNLQPIAFNDVLSLEKWGQWFSAHGLPLRGLPLQWALCPVGAIDRAS